MYIQNTGITELPYISRNVSGSNFPSSKNKKNSLKNFLHFRKELARPENQKFERKTFLYLIKKQNFLN